MIKTATLAILAWRLLRSNRKASVGMALSQALLRMRHWAGRAADQLNLWKPYLPDVLILLRIALGPGIVFLSIFSHRGSWLVACIAVAMLSDILDGMLAQRWHVDTEDHYRWDSRADLFFYACVLLVAVTRYPGAFERRWILVACLLAAEIAQHAFARIKYGRFASYHSALSKIWGGMMTIAMCALLGFGWNNWILDVTLGWGILCNLQGIVMSAMLPAWHENVLTIFHAVQLRRQDAAMHLHNKQAMVA
jgi:CDP-diacylglycerol--glycerol-3-phosphate 3-phosphatidyltransferase